MDHLARILCLCDRMRAIRALSSLSLSLSCEEPRKRSDLSFARLSSFAMFTRSSRDLHAILSRLPTLGNAHRGSARMHAHTHETFARARVKSRTCSSVWQSCRRCQTRSRSPSTSVAHRRVGREREIIDPPPPRHLSGYPVCKSRCEMTARRPALCFV